MAQHDYVIDNSTGANVRADINNALLAISSTNSGSSAPSTTYAFQLFANTTTSKLQIRNAGNSAFVDLIGLDGSILLPDGSVSSPSLAFSDDLNTGIFSSAADTFNVATGGVERMELGTTTIFNEDGADVDFRIEGDTEANLFYVDAGNNKVAVGSSTPSSKFTVVDTTAFTSFASSTPSASQCMLQLFNNPSSEAANHHSTVQFGVFGGTHNRIATISAVSESASNRKLGLVFCTDSGANRNERMRLTGDGSLGLGTSSPTSKLDCAGNIALTASDPKIFFNTGGSMISNANVANTLAFFSDGSTERMRIDSSGNVLINTTQAFNSLNGRGNLVVGSGSGNEGITIFTGTSNTGGITFADGTSGDAAYRGQLEYSHSADAMTFNTAASERMRINSDGTVIFKGSAANVANTEFRFGSSNLSPFASFNHTAINANHTFLQFKAAGSQIGEIKDDGTGGVSYASNSDYRLKENVVDLTGAIARLKNLKPKRFNFLVSADVTQDGFLAHELQEVVPIAVSGTKDEVVTADSKNNLPFCIDLEIGDPIYQTADMSYVIPLLTAALQEAIIKVETLETKVAALEAA